MAKITEEIEREKELQAGQHCHNLFYCNGISLPSFFYWNGVSILLLPSPSMLRSVQSTLGALHFILFWNFTEYQQEIDRFWFLHLEIFNEMFRKFAKSAKTTQTVFFS